MKNLFLSLLLLIVVSSLAFSQQTQLIRVYLNNLEEAELLYSYDLDFATPYFKKYADIIVSEAEKNFLLKRGFNFEILSKDLRREFEENVKVDDDMGAYHTYQEMVTEINQVHASYPNITMISNIGQSIEGRVIWAVKVSDNPNTEEADEPDVLYIGNIHAREVATPEVILHFLNYLVNNYGSDSTVTYLIDNREMWLIPTMNPDGHVYVENVDAMWRKNRRNNGDGSYGVDLNRNFGYKWGYDNSGSSSTPASNTYRGTGPFSEPETQAIRQLCISHHFVISLMYHSYGRLWLFPWGYIPQNTPHHDVFMQIAQNCVAYNGYLPGNYAMGVIYRVNGDSDDYFYGEQSEKNMIFGFTPEIGNLFWPPESDLPQILQENLGPNLYVASIAGIIADNPHRLKPPAIPVIDEMTEDEDGNYTVSWTIQDDPVNPAVTYELQELSGDTLVTEYGDGADQRWQMNGFVISQQRAYSASKSIYSQMDNNLNNTLTAKFPLLVTQGMNLTFQTWYDIEDDWDYAYVEVSTDGGTTFESIPGNITTNYDPYGNNAGNGITGFSNGWVQAVFDLSAFAGQSIILRMRYATDGAVLEEGIYFDDIYPVPLFANVTSLASNISTTNYNISGKSQGTYFYRVRAKDADDQWGGWSQMEDIVVTGGGTNCLLGDVNMDGTISPGDALCAFRRYLYGSFSSESGCANSCAETVADVNCTPDGITPGDALYIFQAYLAGKTPPLDCMPGNAIAKSTNKPRRLWLEQIDDKGTYLKIGIFIDNPGSFNVFGLDIGFQDDILAFVSVEKGEILNTWQEFGASVPVAGVVRVGGFTEQNTNLASDGLIAILNFRILKDDFPSAEIWTMNFKDNLGEIENSVLKINNMNYETTQKIDRYYLSQNYPNPFNSSTIIEYGIPIQGDVEISIYNTHGQKIQSYYFNSQHAGKHSVEWNGKTESGEDAATGIYLVTIKSKDFADSKKIIFLK